MHLDHSPESCSCAYLGHTSIIVQLLILPFRLTLSGNILCFKPFPPHYPPVALSAIARATLCPHARLHVNGHALRCILTMLEICGTQGEQLEVSQAANGGRAEINGLCDVLDTDARSTSTFRTDVGRCVLAFAGSNLYALLLKLFYGFKQAQTATKPRVHFIK